MLPLTTTDLPNTAELPRGSDERSCRRPGSVDIGMPSLASSDEVGGTDTDFGTNSSSFRRFHMRRTPPSVTIQFGCLLSYYACWSDVGAGLDLLTYTGNLPHETELMTNREVREWYLRQNRQ